MKLANNPRLQDLARQALTSGQPLSQAQVDTVARDLGVEPKDVRGAFLEALRALERGVAGNEQAGAATASLRSMMGDGVGAGFLGQKTASATTPALQGANLRVPGEGPAAGEAHLTGRLRQQAVVENLLNAVMADRPGCDTWELGKMSKLPDGNWVVPVRLTLILEEGLLKPKKTDVDVRYAVVDGEGRHLATHREHPVAGAETSFPKNGLNSWDFRGPVMGG